MRQRKLFDDTPLFATAVDTPRRPRPASTTALCPVCTVEQVTLPSGAFAVPICIPCRAAPLATLDRIERDLIAIEERRAAAWQPLQTRLAQLTPADFERYCAIWLARSAATTEDGRAAVERRVLATRDKRDTLSRLLDLEVGQLEAIETTYRETEPPLKALRAAQYDLLSLRESRGWTIPPDITARRAALVGMRPAVLERV